MGRERAVMVRAAIEDLARVDGAWPPLIGHACGACARMLGAAGVCASTRGADGVYEPLCVVGPAGAALAESQVTVGEGPGMAALGGGRPVLVTDLDAASVQRRWPLFAPTAAELGMATVFAFPLLVGAVTVGALEIYWIKRPVRSAALDDGLLFADAVLLMLMTELTLDGAGSGQSGEDLAGADADGAGGGSRAARPGEPVLDRWPEVHQAAGMMSVQLETELGDAYVRLRAHAFANDLSLREVARQVVGRTLRFTPDRRPR